jgi:excinuclease ABC subunit C
MYDATGAVIYVGKAKNLRHRVSSYFQRQLDNKTLHLVRHVADIHTTVTQTEREALLLENNLIKTHQPKYNILLKDDKSYPFLRLTTQDTFPRLCFQRHQGHKKPKGEWYGPYPNARALREALNRLQSVFQLRQCDTHFFNTRTRPCLQYQIQRCSAPCVGYISPADYQASVQQARQFLQGKDEAVMEQLAQAMESASQAQHYEKAARIRDQLIQLRALQARQLVMTQQGDLDVIGMATHVNRACFYVLSLREGKMVSSRPYYITQVAPLSREELLEAFILQQYGEVGQETGVLSQPPVVVAQLDADYASVLTHSLSTEQLKTPTIVPATRGDKLRWVNMANENAQQALEQHMATKKQGLARFEALQLALGLPELPERIECVDVSHTAGEATIGAFVSFTKQGPDKTAYRFYAIEGITPGDDYAAISQALTRHYTQLRTEDGPLPDVLLVDGGKGQLHRAEQALHALQVENIPLIGVAKGPGRRSGEETLYLSSQGKTLPLSATSPAFHLIQQIRDEAHRFAITRHRQKRAKKRLVSQLDEIPGIGEKRKQALLRYFGHVKAIKNASIEDIAKVPGISRALAQTIVSALSSSSRSAC